jgi:hypothetical protein
MADTREEIWPDLGIDLEGGIPCNRTKCSSDAEWRVFFAVSACRHRTLVYCTPCKDRLLELARVRGCWCAECEVKDIRILRVEPL